MNMCIPNSHKWFLAIEDLMTDIHYVLYSTVIASGVFLGEKRSLLVFFARGPWPPMVLIKSLYNNIFAHFQEP